MSIEEKINEAKAKRRQIASQVNALLKQRALLLQEALRLEGEIRALEELQKAEMEIK